MRPPNDELDLERAAQLPLWRLRQEEVRFDTGEFGALERLPNGWVRCVGYIARVGVQEYPQPDGSIRRELRPPDEIFDPASMASFSMVPVCDGHPDEMLDAANTGKHARGHLGEVISREGDRIRATVLLTDAGLIRRVLDQGIRQLSAGYRADVDFTPGIWNGERYDAVQRRVRANHVSVVPRGRAGPTVALKLDSPRELGFELLNRARSASAEARERMIRDAERRWRVR